MNRTSHPRRLGQQSAKILPTRGALQIEDLSIEDLHPYENNPRLHPQKQIDKLARGIRDFGFLIPVLIDDKNRILAGHARIDAAKTLGLLQVPCVRARHLSEAQKRAFTILDNRLAEDATWDFELLAKEIEFLQNEGIELQARPALRFPKSK